MSDVLDVIIIGAGLSGLQAAVDLQKGGRTIAVLEARNCVGGKTRSVQRSDGKGVQEMGAAWLNDSNQARVWNYCQEFGLTPVLQANQGLVASEDEDGTCHFFPFGAMPNFSASEVDNITAIRDVVEAASLDPASYRQPERARLDGITFEQFCRDAGAGTRALNTARLWCRGTLGQDPNEVSALSFLEIARGGLGIINLRYDGKHGAQYLRLEEGTQAIAIGISKMLPTGTIHLNTAVNTVTQNSSNLCTVTASRGQVFKAQKVIISIPGPSYKNITYSPPLPPLKHIFRGPLNHCRDTSVDHAGNYALTCFITSAPGRKWACLSDEDRRKTVLKQLGSLFGVGHAAVETELLDTITSEWVEDRWAGWGCPVAATPPGVIGSSLDGEMIQEKFGAIYFIGTELAEEWRGYMEVALQSGERGAAQALEDFRLQDTRL
ncbi:flavin containing amine oxidoreductase [Colletotrichum lupini]|uniref:Amine oxidase n=1 Tax=Colletotrichum lupini TaxID=145971 RepID=A0A9Q8WB49_9PEZI|nr:flavin containing amine oxidoreductase [Colletotrichum lupini]UQC76716.1 flavin containing amine oxidoreductase [Colletotrichum lupini]